ncbi:MAG: hypothetical protein LBI45_02145 [Bacteroidales bacterium]|jgi:hypothetical protein|nr:hypothetical protein [Bacteroidales bacterium]
MEHFASIILGAFVLIQAVILGWFAYNQKTKDKMTELKIEGVKLENEKRIATNNRSVATIHGVLWGLLHELDFSRCFIIQPHPEHKHLYLSVAFEVDKPGVSEVKAFFQNIPISTMAKFVKEIATTSIILIEDVDREISDTKAQSMMMLAGTSQLILKQLMDENGSWIGTLVVENTNRKQYNKEEAIEKMVVAATHIQYILPPIN